MKNLRPLLVATLCALSLAAPALALAQGSAISDATQPVAPSAQPSGQPGAHHHHGMAAMLRNLNLSQQQQDQIKTLITSYKQAHPQGSQPDQAARKQLKEQILAVLTPDQRAKLEAEKAAWKKQHGTVTPSASPSP